MKPLHVIYGVQILFILISIPLIFEKIGPNGLYGFRTSKTLSDDKIWYKANKFSGWTVLIAGVVSIVYLFVLQLCKKYYFPTLVVESWAIGIIIPILIAIVVSIIYVAKIPDDDEVPAERKKFMESFMTSSAIKAYTILCIISIVLAVPLAFGKIGPNRIYGFRINKTFSNEEIWYQANTFSGCAIIVASCITLASLLFMKQRANIPAWYNNGLVYLTIYLGPLAISFLVSLLYILKL